MKEETYITIDGVMLTLTELIIAFALLTVKSMTIAEAAAEGCRRDASPVRDMKGLSYEECAKGNTACEMLIIAGIAEWANKTRSAIRITPDGFDVADEITKAYTQRADASESPDVAACAVAETETTRKSSAGAAEAQAAFTVGSLVTAKPTSPARWTKPRVGILMAIDRMGTDNIRLVQVNWGSYGTFWDRVKSLEVLNESR